MNSKNSNQGAPIVSIHLNCIIAYINGEPINLTMTLEEVKRRQDRLKTKALRAKVPLERNPPNPIIVDGFQVSAESWARAYLEFQISPAAKVLFKALFSSEEIRSSTLTGRGGTPELNRGKREAIYRAVGWMRKNRMANKNPYSFEVSATSTSDLSAEEKGEIEKKVFIAGRSEAARAKGQKIGSFHKFKIPQTPKVEAPCPTGNQGLLPKTAWVVDDKVHVDGVDGDMNIPPTKQSKV